MLTQIDLPADQIADFCQRHHIRRLALFGSVLGDDFGPDSDVDVLVEFEPEAIIGWKIVTIEEELGNLIQRPVDLKTEGDLSRHIRHRVATAAQVIYEQAR
jgi:hypothetical protein